MKDIVVPYPRKFLPKQKEVFDASKKKKFILYSGAYGAGKTLLLSHVVMTNCMQYPKSLWFVGSQTVPMLRDTVVRTFIEEVDLYQESINKVKSGLPNEKKYLLDVKICKQWKPSIMSFKFFNDSEVLFRSCDEPSKFKSLNLDGFAIDEPVDIDEQVFLMLQGRLRGNHTKNRMAIMVGNPSGRTNWVYQTFFEKKKENPKRYKDYHVVQTTTYDNSFLPMDYIKNCENNFDEDYARRYLYGEWGSFEGQVYKDFKMDKHVGSFKNTECAYHIAGFDDGTRNPACLLVVGIDRDNNMFIKEEMYESGLVDSEKADKIYWLNERYKGFRKIYCDPSALSMIQALKNKRLRVDGADNDITSGISKLKSFFKNDIVHIDKSCKNLIKEIESYRYEKDKFSKNLTELPIKKNDHGCDALRYSITAFNPFRERRKCIGLFR